jgi:uncharacterized protein
MIRPPLSRALAAALPLLLSAACGVRHAMPIGRVQGAVEGGRGAAHVSPYVGRIVTVRGVVCQRLWRPLDGESVREWIALQELPAYADENAMTSDALLATLRDDGSIPSSDGPVRPAVGMEVVLRGRVEEYDGHTTLADPFLLRILRTDVDPVAEIPAPVACPPDTRAEADLYWERLEGMQVLVPTQVMAQGGVTFDWWQRHGLQFVVCPDDWIENRRNPHAARVFRDAHPLDDHPDPLFDNENGYVFAIGDYGLRATADPPAAALPPTRTFARLTEPLRGTVVHARGLYAVHPATPPRFHSRVDPAARSLPTRDDRHLTVATYNVENLYDARDDPFDDRDYALSRSSTNEPVRLANYVPASEEAYQQKLRGLAGQIVEDLQAPDILMLQEVEDQDIARVEQGALQYGFIDRRDGRLDSLQALALAILRAGGPLYRSAADRAAADERGIACGFLYRPDRVRLTNPSQDHPLLGTRPRVSDRPDALAFTPRPSNPKALSAADSPQGRLFSRPPVCAEFVTAEGRRILCINNHFRSRPDHHVARRIEQARFAADLARTALAMRPAPWVIVGGDLNTFPRPDEPRPAEPADQLGALYEAGLANVESILMKTDPASAYTYVFRGQAQTLDHLFVCRPLWDRLAAVRAVHINSDYSPGDPHPRRAFSDHDPVWISIRP